MGDKLPSTSTDQKPATKTTTKAGGTLADGTKIVYHIEYTEPGSPQDQRLADEQTKAVLALLADVAAKRSRRRSIADQTAMDPIATTKSPAPPQAS
jgi:hypothetical protein